MSEEIAAIEWLSRFIDSPDSALPILGRRWLINARAHLEDRVERELRAGH